MKDDKFFLPSLEYKVLFFIKQRSHTFEASISVIQGIIECTKFLSGNPRWNNAKNPNLSYTNVYGFWVTQCKQFFKNIMVFSIVIVCRKKMIFDKKIYNFISKSINIWKVKFRYLALF